MRKISLLLVAAMLLSAGSVMAKDPNKEKEPVKSLSQQIKSLLRNNNFTTNEEGKTAQVLFTLNSEREIVVLSVDTDDATLDAFIKASLNYHEVDLSTFEEGKKYTVSVSISA